MYLSLFLDWNRDQIKAKLTGEEAMPTQSKNCQSCGMPLSKGPGGTERDGSKSLDYCGYCYQNGEFTEPNITLEEMIEKVNGKMAEMHIPRFLGRFFTKKIPKLKRWR